MAYTFNAKTIETDAEGYLLDLDLWCPELAVLIAQSEDIEMGSDHWEVVNFVRNYYQEYQVAPAIRVLTRAIHNTLGPEKANSRHLYRLFPDGPAKQACKIGGLPKPTACI
jgi:tRNA 2-thiouridine synthesizing protein E